MFITKIGSFLNKNDREDAAKLVAKGEIVGIFNRGVCALWFDGANPKAIAKMIKIKGGGRGKKAIALTLSLEEFIPMIDLAKLSPSVSKFLSTPDLKSKIGSLCFIRAPLRDGYQNGVPEHAKTFSEDGVCMIQNWDSHGHNAASDFLKKIKQLNIKYPAVTSMNLTDQPEIVDQKEAENFCAEHKIPIFLKDPKAHPDHKGSYTIITLDKDGVKLSRDGNIPGWIIEQITGMQFQKNEAKKSSYPQIIPDQLVRDLKKEQKAEQVRLKVLQYLKYV